MNIENIFKATDHTLLKQETTMEQIMALCDEGLEYGTASVCIPPSYVSQAAEYLNGRLSVCTVIGFPNGYSTTAVKVFETENAIENGADEIDMVINIGWLKDKRYDDILSEIRAVRAACKDKILKVIIETCLLTEDEKIKMCEIVSQSGADFIKTSTGFSTGGATADDIILLSEHIAPHVKIKAAGGIGSLSDAEEFMANGASRLGTSRLKRIADEIKNKK